MERVRKRKSAADRKLEIIETTIRLAGDIGPDRVTTQHLADAVGLTQPAIFRHFATKTDIWNAVGEHLVGLANGAACEAAEPPASETDPHEELLDTLSDQISYIAQNPSVCYILASRELMAHNETLREMLTGVLKKRHADLTKLIEKAKAAGLHAERVHPSDAAHVILSALQGLSMRWSLEGKPFDFVGEAERLMRSMTDGLRA